jgi:beta-mannosidase
MARARLVGIGASCPIGGEWELAAVPPGLVQTPDKLDAFALSWIGCDGPLPAAAALRTAGLWSFERPRDFDAEDWWYRCRFAPPSGSGRYRLRFEGLATVADVWLNGRHILHSENMFVEHAVDADGLVDGENELALRFHSMSHLLADRRARPRWRTGLVRHQQLRWHRTTLLGQIPAWCPPVAAVGPWRPISLEPVAPLLLERAEVRTELAGDEGIVHATIHAAFAPGSVPSGGVLTVGEVQAPVAIEQTTDRDFVLRAIARLPRARRWWPHTHGTPALYPARISIEGGGRPMEVDLGRVGFRTLEVDRGADGEGFGIRVNGADIFCRGVCWTPLDLARLVVEPDAYREALERLRDAGMNMIRVSGTMVYEAEAFHDLCDELGILLWQDLMFANMDYPAAHDAFAHSITLETRQQLERLQSRPSLAVLCGNSEVEQQVAMLGLPAEMWTSPLFSATLPGIAAEVAPDVPFLPSTPTGGTLPFQTDRGVSHYYGVGAYLRPFDDVRRAGVRFASECLGFSNVPELETVDLVLREGESPGHHPRWKARVPRDAGAGWDFEDVRDHYVALLFGVDATGLRARDPERYLALGRVATGEAMLRVFAEWRRVGSSCRGGLVWFAHDLWPGAGWGIIDSSGRPKAAYWYLKRALAPIALLATDEGLNGLQLHVVNDSDAPVKADLCVSLYRGGQLTVASATTSLMVQARGAQSVHADALFEGFRDLTYAYRFGPPGHDVVAARLIDPASGMLLGSAQCFPCGLPADRTGLLGLNAQAVWANGGFLLHLRTERFAHAVAIEADGVVPDDNYLHLEPGVPRRVFLRAADPSRPLRGIVAALNGSDAAPIVLVEESGGI